jgi:hypothetical protein
MHVARTKLLLWLTAAAGALGAGACVAAALLLPLDVPAPAPPRAAGPAEATGPAAPSMPPLADFEQAWAVALRRPLTDPPPQLAAATTGPSRPANLMVRLVGTIVDGERPRGVFMVGLAALELKGVGDKAGGAEILRIDAESATLAYNGQTFVLKREKNPFDTTGATAEMSPIRPAVGADEGS